MKVSNKELELGIRLIDRLTSEQFNPKNYKDEYRRRVLAMLDERARARRYHFSASSAAGQQIVEIMEAPRHSMELG